MSLSQSTIKRLTNEVKILKKEMPELFDAYPDPDNILVWYFVVKGPENSDFTGGYYLGKVMHSTEYPLKAPDFMMLTPNGRFNVGTKICLSNSGYHSNEWSPMWNIINILVGFLSIMLDDNENGISHIHDDKKTRKNYAENSVAYNKSNYINIVKNFTRFFNEDGSVKNNNTINITTTTTTTTNKPK